MTDGGHAFLLAPSPGPLWCERLEPEVASAPITCGGCRLEWGSTPSTCSISPSREFPIRWRWRVALLGLDHDLIVALSPQVEVDAARVAVQSDASLARLRHAHPTATLRRLVGSGQVARYSTLTIEVAGEEHLAVDHVVMQADRANIGVRIDGRPLPDGQVVQVVAANPLAGLPRSPSLDPLAIGSVTVLSDEGGPGHSYGLEANQQLSCTGQDPVEVHIDGRRCASPVRELTICGGSRDLELVVVDEAGTD